MRVAETDRERRKLRETGDRERVRVTERDRERQRLRER